MIKIRKVLRGSNRLILLYFTYFIFLFIIVMVLETKSEIFRSLWWKLSPCLAFGIWSSLIFSAMNYKLMNLCEIGYFL